MIRSFLNQNNNPIRPFTATTVWLKKGLKLLHVFVIIVMHKLIIFVNFMYTNSYNVILELYIYIYIYSLLYESQNKKYFSTHENIKLSIHIVDPFCKHGSNFYGTKDKIFIRTFIIFVLN